ncbi:MAG: Na/Pi cotransporter family protein, partial [Bacillota bacterium]|nr:Na/Pi cotransporter family protein [Bacillota bacterium]
SSTTTVMIVGFVNSGLMNLTQAVGTIMGANIGTTITAQLVSFDIYAIALPMIGLSALFYYFSKKKIQRHVALGLLGFGLVLLGLSTMSEAVQPIRTYEPILQSLVTFGEKPLLGILAGALFTVLIQSSSATTGIVIAASWQGILTLPAGLALIVGANLGTCITVILASIGSSLTGKRAALSHVLFNAFGVLLFIIFRKPFTNLVLLTGSSVARQIANAHTFFNIATTLILFPLLPYFVKLVMALTPGEDEVIIMKAKFLDSRTVHTPAALFNAQREAVRMGNETLTMVEQSVNAFLNSDLSLLERIDEREEMVNLLEKVITAYLAEANQHSMGEAQARAITNLMHIVNDIERIGDHAMNIMNLTIALDEGGRKISEAASADLQSMYEVVSRITREAMEALLHNDVAKAKRLVAEDDLVDEMEKLYRSNHIERVNEGLCSPEVGVLFLDSVSNLERIADHAVNIAEGVADIAFFKNNGFKKL